MQDKTKQTRQGIRDLNYYGPRTPRPATQAATAAEEPTTATPDVTAPMPVVDPLTSTESAQPVAG